MIDYFSAAKAAIISKLQGLTKVNTNFIFGYEKGELGGYPAITITGQEYYAKYGDTCSDAETYVFELKIWQERGDVDKGLKTASQTETIIDDALVEVMQSLQQDFTLGGVIDKMELSATKFYSDREIMMRGAFIKITCSKLNPL